MFHRAVKGHVEHCSSSVQYSHVEVSYGKFPASFTNLIHWQTFYIEEKRSQKWCGDGGNGRKCAMCLYSLASPFLLKC